MTGPGAMHGTREHSEVTSGRVARVHAETPSATASVDLAANAFDLSPRARALLRGVEIAHQDLRDSGGAYDLDQVRALLHGVTRQRVDKRVEEGSLLAVPGPSNVRRYPVAQFMDDGSILPGLREVLNSLPTKSGFAALNFLIRPDERLDGRKPIDLLKEGDIDRVVGAARAYGLAGS